jgi:hypothetical protein
VVAGDIACAVGEIRTPVDCHQRSTAALFAEGGALHGRRLRGFVLVGDTQYELGRTQDYPRFDGTWGKAIRQNPQARVLPTPGNHEYGNPNAPTPGCVLADTIHNACGFERYFGRSALPRRGDDRGDYVTIFGAARRHPLVIIVLNVGRCEADYSACGPRGQVARFLRTSLRDPAVNPPQACTVVAWHQARWSDYAHGDLDHVGPVWRSLFVTPEPRRPDLVLNGHDHLYFRMPKLSNNGVPNGDGIPEVIAGAGGKEIAGIPFAGDPPGRTAFADPGRFGVVRMTWSGADGYVKTAFVTEGGSVVDPHFFPCAA